ncbi:MAG: tyrosine-type recombinase/integrase [Magnetococcales bacterium]|nr:tyrosine-type recombinase/integrase [Magnetococcales bacterium]
MAIRKTSSGWVVDIQPGGRGRRRYRKTFATKADAKRWELHISEKISQKPEWKPQQRDTRRLLDLVELWNDRHGKRLHSDQYKRLKAVSERLGNPVVTAFHVSKFVMYRESRLNEGITPGTLNREHAYLRGMFHELGRLGVWGGGNPLQGLRQLKIPERELSFLTLEEIERLLDAAAKSRSQNVRLVIEVCLSTGARWSEAESLCLEQVHDGRVDFVGDRTKSGKNRSVPVSLELVEKLRSRRSERGRIFQGCYGAFRRCVKRAELDLPRGQLSHVLRHTFASHFMMNGGNIITLQRILGHQSLTMTMRYAHLSPDHLKEAVKLNPLSALTLG